MNNAFLTRRRAVHAAHDRQSRHRLVLGAAVLAAGVLHLSFAMSLAQTGTDGERIHASRASIDAGLVADLGELPMITVVGRRVGAV